MSIMPEKDLSRMEQYVMKCIWDAGEALTPNEIRIRLRNDYQKEYAYPTINTFLRSIMKKGYIDQNRDTYNYRYSARVSEEDYRKRELSQFRKKGETVNVNWEAAEEDGGEVRAHIGLENSENGLRYVIGEKTGSHTFTIKETDTYRVFVENKGDSRVTVDMAIVR